MFGNVSFLTHFPGQSSVPTSFVFLFVFYIFSYLLSKTMGCFDGCLMSSAGIQKLFCRIYSALKCSLDEFVREKVVSPPYSSAILGPPPDIFLKSVCRRCIIQLIMGSVDSEFAICQYWVNKHSRHSAIVYAVFYP